MNADTRFTTLTYKIRPENHTKACYEVREKLCTVEQNLLLRTFSNFCVMDPSTFSVPSASSF